MMLIMTSRCASIRTIELPELADLRWPSGGPIDRVPRTDEVHLWCAQLANLRQRCDAFLRVLSHSEQATAMRHIRDSDRLLSVCSRGMLRAVLAAYLGAQPGKLDFVLGPYGKPALARELGLSFNLTHSGGLVLLAVSGPGANIGVDLELRREIKEWQSLAARHFHPIEVEELFAMDSAKGQHAFFDFWTRKEAIAKASGMGLSLPLHSFRIGVACSLDAQLLEGPCLPERDRPWFISPLDVASGYAATVAVAGVRRHCVYRWQFDPTETWWDAL